MSVAAFREVLKRICRVPSGPAGGQFASCGTGGSGTGRVMSQTAPAGAGGAGGGSQAAPMGIAFPRFASGSSGNPKKFNAALTQMQAIMGNSALTPAQKILAIQSVSGPAASHNYGKRLANLKAQAIGILQHQAAPTPPPSAPTGPFNKQPHRQNWNQNLVNRLTAAANGPNPAQAIAAIGLSAHAHKSVHDYQKQLLQHFGQQGQTPPPAPPPPPKTAPTPPTPGVAGVTGAVGGITGSSTPKPPAALPTPPAVNTSYPANDQALFLSRVKALQDAATSKNPEAALQAVTVRTPDLIKYKDELLEHTKQQWLASPAGQAHAAKIKAAQAAVAAATANWDKEAAKEFSHYQPAKHTDPEAHHTVLSEMERGGISQVAVGLGANHSNVRGRVAISAISDSQGFSGKPRVVSDTEFDRIMTTTGAIELRRGISDHQQRGDASTLVDQFRHGPLFTSGSASAYGDGTYTHAEVSDGGDMHRGPTSTRYRQSADGQATSYAHQGQYGSGTIFRMALHPKARIGNLQSIRREYYSAHTKWNQTINSEPYGSKKRQRAEAAKQLYQDVGVFAASRGYDGYKAADQGSFTGNGGKKSHHYYFVLLNRSAVIVSDHNRRV